MKVFIEVGHGGTDIGGVFIGKSEKDMNLEVALKLQKIISSDSRITLKLSRDSDYFVGLDNIALYCNQFIKSPNEGICIAIHHNANNGNSFGWEIIKSAFSPNGTKLAECIGSRFNSYLKKGRGIFTQVNKSGQDYFSTIRQTICPAIITEACYMDSQDYYNFNSDKEAIALYQGICDYAGIQPLELIAPSNFEENLIKGLKQLGSSSPEYWLKGYNARAFNPDNVKGLLNLIAKYFSM